MAEFNLPRFIESMRVGRPQTEWKPKQVMIASVIFYGNADYEFPGVEFPRLSNTERTVYYKLSEWSNAEKILSVNEITELLASAKLRLGDGYEQQVVIQNGTPHWVSVRLGHKPSGQVGAQSFPVIRIIDEGSKHELPQTLGEVSLWPEDWEKRLFDE